MTQLSRNARYEQTQKDKGLVKVTLWLPESVAPNFKLAASLCTEHSQLTLTSLRNIATGRFVSIEKPVTGDSHE